jgi:hypothetical protein
LSRLKRIPLFVETFGVTGPTQSQRCDDNNIGTDHTWEGRLFIDHSSSVSNADVVIGGSSSTGTGAGSADEVPSWFASALASLLAALKPAKPAVCTGLDAKVAAATPGVYSSANTALQKHLGKDYGHLMPALYPVATTAFGFYGSQTSVAVAAAVSDCR